VVVGEDVAIGRITKPEPLPWSPLFSIAMETTLGSTLPTISVIDSGI